MLVSCKFKLKDCFFRQNVKNINNVFYFHQCTYFALAVGIMCCIDAYQFLSCKKIEFLL